MADDDSNMMRSVKIRKPRTMVARKYLCAAPHPSKWDDHAEALLKSLGGNQKKREQVLKQTLETLEEMHAGIRKTGPGRKSNAEHAIAFYLYVLEFNENTTDDFGEDRSNLQADNKRHRAVPEQPTTEGVKKEPAKEPGKKEADGDEDDEEKADKEEVEADEEEADEEDEADEEEEDEEEEEEEEEEEAADEEVIEKKSVTSASTMDSKEFLDQHNDQCEVCNLGGQLLCCSTCNLVFHLECVRPSLKELPKDNWSCAYCIASGVVGHSRDSKTRRKAKAAVLAMARLSPKKRKQAINDDDSDDDSDHEEEKQPSSSGKSEGKEEPVEATASEVAEEEKDQKETSETTSSEMKEEENEPKTTTTDQVALQEETSEERQEEKAEKPSEEDAKDPDGCDASKESSENTSETRARRPRRQPTLFDPQSGAARKWQSDVSMNWKLKSPSDETNKEGEPNDEDEEVKNINNVVEQVVEEEEGNEGNDDASPRKTVDGIWCNFCKDDPSVTICCFCACRVCFGKHDASKLLLCDNCDDEYHTFCLDPPLDTVPTSRKWFCPSCDPSEKKAKPNNGAVGTRSSNKPPSTASKPPSPTPYGTRSTVTPKKAPPPPPKEPVVVEKVKEIVAVKIKRPVGRPRKTEAPPVADQVPQPPRKRGRPPKSAAAAAAAAAAAYSEEEEQKPRKRGRPPKVDSEKAEETPKPARKRGRPPKSRSPLSGNRATTPSDTASRPAKKQKVKHSSSSGATPTRSKASSTPRNADSSHTRGFETRTQSQSGKDDILSPNNTQSNVGNVPLPNLPDARFHETTSPMLSPRLSAFPGGGQVSEHAENMLQNISSSSSLTGQPGANARTHRSRSGRTVKRSSFHDEIEEGEQHLRSHRYALEMQRRAAAAAMDPTLTTADYEDEDWDPLLDAPEIEDHNSKQAALPTSLNSNPNLKSAPADSNDNAENAVTDDNLVRSEVQQPVVASSAEPLLAGNPVLNSASLLPTEVTHTEIHSVQGPFDMANSQSSLGESAAAPSVATSAARAAAAAKVPRRKPGARECMQISRRFGAKVIPQKYMDILQDYCTRGKVEHLIRMRERLDSHSRFLESQLAGLESLVKEKGEIDLVVPPMPGSDKEDRLHPAASIDF